LNYLPAHKFKTAEFYVKRQRVSAEMLMT